MKYPIQAIDRIDSLQGRKYKTPMGLLYPSITTILSQSKEDNFLNEWREKVGAERADEITKLAGKRGSNLHNICEDYFNGKDLSFPDTTAKWHFKQIEPYLKRISDVRGIEIPLFSDKLKIAGTSDCIAYYDGKLSTIDYKTSRQQKKKEWIGDYFLQATFYSIAVKEMYGELPSQIVIIMATNDNNPCVFVENVRNYTKELILRKRLYDEKTKSNYM